jgi:hypothetical protein
MPTRTPTAPVIRLNDGCLIKHVLVAFENRIQGCRIPAGVASKMNPPGRNKIVVTLFILPEAIKGEGTARLGWHLLF